MVQMPKSMQASWGRRSVHQRRRGRSRSTAPRLPGPGPQASEQPAEPPTHVLEPKHGICSDSRGTKPPRWEGNHWRRRSSRPPWLPWSWDPQRLPHAAGPPTGNRCPVGSPCTTQSRLPVDRRRSWWEPVSPVSAPASPSHRHVTSADGAPTLEELGRCSGGAVRGARANRCADPADLHRPSRVRGPPRGATGLRTPGHLRCGDCGLLRGRGAGRVVLELVPPPNAGVVVRLWLSRVLDTRSRRACGVGFALGLSDGGRLLAWGLGRAPHHRVPARSSSDDADHSRSTAPRSPPEVVGPQAS